MDLFYHHRKQNMLATKQLKRVKKDIKQLKKEVFIHEMKDKKRNIEMF